MRNLMVVFAVVLAITLVGSVATAELFLNEYVTLYSFGAYELQFDNYYSGAPGQWNLSQSNAGTFVIYGGYPTAADRLVIDQVGNVGMSMAPNPGARLSVAGNLYIEGYGGYGLQLNNTDTAAPGQWNIYQHSHGGGDLVIEYAGVPGGLMAVGRNGSIGLGMWPVGDRKLAIANGHIELSNGYGMFFGSGVDTALYGSGAAGTAYIRADVPGQPAALHIDNDGYVDIPKALDVGEGIAADEDVVADADGIPVSLINLSTQINAVDSGLLDRLEALEAIVMDLPPGLLNQKDRNADTK